MRSIIMRIMDGLMSIPPILLAIALMALTRASVENVVIAITIAEIPRVSRLVRGVVLSLREQAYVDAAISCGCRMPMLIWRHILPKLAARKTQSLPARRLAKPSLTRGPWASASAHASKRLPAPLC